MLLWGVRRRPRGSGGWRPALRAAGYCLYTDRDCLFHMKFVDTWAQEHQTERLRHWDGLADNFDAWRRKRANYQDRLSEYYRFLIPPNMKVLEIGSAGGDLLAAVQPARGVGVDWSEKMAGVARGRHPKLEFVVADAHELDLGETFDYIICSDLLNDVWDAQKILTAIARHCGPTTRVIINIFSHLWSTPRKVAGAIGYAPPHQTQNWLTPEDLVNLLALSGLELIRQSGEVLCPFPIPLLRGFADRYLVKLSPFRHAAMTNVFIARLQPVALEERKKAKVSVIVAARNEEGNIAQILERTPQMGGGTELIFVEGNSTDKTWEAINREIAAHPEIEARAYQQTGKGKGDAVRKGYSEATGDLYMILDADLTVPPEDLPRFFEAWASGKGDFINGVRLVYPMRDQAMKFANHVANKGFSLGFSWLLGQPIKDTLCGTKVLSAKNYALLAANRAYFGDFDPYGDFDLIFGAARFNLKILDIPIRYRERTYGTTNISRWSGGVTLLRMCFFALRRLRFV